MTLAIRKAQPGDEALVLKFIGDLAEYEKLRHEVTATVDDIRRQLFGPNPVIGCDIAEWEGAPVGFALWFYNFSTFWARKGIYLEDLFVAPDQRGKGIGKALIANLARRALAEDCYAVQWWVLNWNTPSIGFYESLGAEARTEWTTYRLHGAALKALAAS